MTLRIFAALVIGLAGAGAARAEMSGFDPAQPCGPMLRAASDTDKLMMAAWAQGCLSGNGQGAAAVTIPSVNRILQGMFDDCIADESLSLVALAERQAGGGAAAQGTGGSKAAAEALLMQFLQPGADLPALTAALAPTSDDISAVYAEPLAGKLTASYAQMFTPGVQIGPKPDQDTLLIYYGTTGQLKSGMPIASQFPGGYGDVAPYFIGDQPIVRFKFVTEGEELGLAFDGLIYVNGRWVFMPKPWRALE
mgnify:CR=1 FL=1